MSACPKCNKKSISSSHVVGFVSVVLEKCTECTNIETKCTLLTPFAIHEFVSEVERLRKSHVVCPPPQVKATIIFIQNMVDLHAKNFPKQFAERRQKLLDRFEQQIIRDAAREYA